MCFEYQRIKFQKEWVKIFAFALRSGPRGLPLPPYGQPDHKIVVFLTIGLIWFEENLMELQFIGG